MCTRAMILVFSRRRREKNVGTRDPTIASPPPFSLLTSDKKKGTMDSSLQQKYLKQ